MISLSIASSIIALGMLVDNGIVIAYVSSGGPRFFLVLSPVQPSPHVAFLVVDTHQAEQVPVVMTRLRQHFLDAVPEATGRVKQMWMGPAEPGFLEVRPIGPDAATLYDKGNQLVDPLRAMPGSLAIRYNWENRSLKARIRIDQVRARHAFINATTVGYGDLRPSAGRAKLLAVILALVGLICTGMVVATALHAADYADGQVYASTSSPDRAAR